MCVCVCVCVHVYVCVRLCMAAADFFFSKRGKEILGNVERKLNFKLPQNTFHFYIHKKYNNMMKPMKTTCSKLFRVTYFLCY